MRFFCVLVFILSVLHCVNTQAQLTEQQLASQYRQQFPEEKAVLLKAETEFTFSFERNAAQPVLLEKDFVSLLSLRDNQSVPRVKFYDDQSAIRKVTATNANGNRINVESICGNYESDDIFYSDAKLCAYKLNFEKTGQVKNIEIQKEYKDLKYFTSVYFHDLSPSRQRKITFVIPDWLDVDIREMNFGGYAIKKNPLTPRKEGIAHEYVVENLQPMSKESYARGQSYTYPHLLVLFKKYRDKGKETPLLGSVNDLYQWYAGLAKTVENDRKILEPTVQKLLTGKTSDEAKIKAIYYWVQDNIRYIAFENGIAGFKPEAAHLVFQNRYGDCKGMANLAKAMLQIAGYDARLTWIGTNKIAYDYSMPTLAVDNHMICTLLLNGKKYYIDPTEKFCSLNENAERIQGRSVLIENGDMFLLEKVPVFAKERNLVATEQLFRIENQLLTGTGKTVFNGESKTGLLYTLKHTKKSHQQELLEAVVSHSSSHADVKKLETSPLSDRDQPLTIAYDFQLKNQVSDYDDELYVNLDQAQEYKDFTIDTKRVSDLDFNEKIWRTTKIKLQIPAGYQVFHLPVAVDKKFANFSFLARYTVAGGEIIYEKQISIDKGIITKKEFADWNTAIKAMRALYDEQIVLKKK